MKQILPLLLATGLAVTLGGCQSATDSTESTGSIVTDDTPSPSLDPANFTLVTLKVPNMI